MPNPQQTPCPSDELDQAPLEPHQKTLVLRHVARLQHIIHHVDELAIGRYTNKQAAREQLARMTLIIRDYASLPRENEEAIESAAMDIIDAAMSTCGAPASFSEATFVNSQLWGREQEVAAIMQEQSAQSVDDVIELWNTMPEKKDTVLPDKCSGCDLGEGIDWENLFVRRRRSESDLGLLRSRGPEMSLEEFEEWRSDMILGRSSRSRRKRGYTHINQWMATL